MRRAFLRLRYAVSLSLALVATATHADIYVIVNPENSNHSLTRQQVADLYLGRARTFQGGEFARILDHTSDNPIRERFFRQLADMSISQVNSYWARLTFTGRKIPPEMLLSDGAVIEAVRNNPRAIGYVERAPTDGSVLVVFKLQE